MHEAGPLAAEAPLSAVEFAALVDLNGSLGQRRPAPEIETRLRRLGLIERYGTSGLPVRTALGNARVAAGSRPAGDKSLP